MRGRLLVIAGSDSGGGAGIQADIRSASAMGAYTMTALTALTAQDTHKVHAVHSVSPEFVTAQIEICLGDIGADTVKIGMLHDIPTINAVMDTLKMKAPNVPRIVDPVMVAKGGDPLLAVGAETALRQRVIPGAFLITPNAPEAEKLSGERVEDESDMERAGRKILAMGAGAVLVKGGHLPGEEILDLLVTPETMRHFRGSRIETKHTHGTGCTLASAIAAGVAQKMELESAVGRARNYVRRAIANAPGLGGGHGPLNHLVGLI